MLVIKQHWCNVSNVLSVCEGVDIYSNNARLIFHPDYWCFSNPEYSSTACHLPLLVLSSLHPSLDVCGMISIDFPGLSIDYTHTHTHTGCSAGFMTVMSRLQASSPCSVTASPTHTLIHAYRIHTWTHTHTHVCGGRLGETGGKPETTGCLATGERRGVAAMGDVLKMMSNQDQ